MPFTRRRRRGYYSSGGGGGGPVTVIADTFDRSTSGNVGTASDGGTWSGFTTYFQCDGSKLVNAQNSAYYQILRNAGAANFTIQFTLSIAQAAKTGFMWRAASDKSSYLRFGMSDATHWFIQQHDAGGDHSNFSNLITVADLDVIKIICSGNDSQVYRNGVLATTLTDVNTAGNTWLGPDIGGSSLAAGSHGWDSLTVTVP